MKKKKLGRHFFFSFIQKESILFREFIQGTIVFKYIFTIKIKKKHLKKSKIF